MKRILSLLSILCFCSSIFAQGIDFFHGTWEEALAEAKKQEKLIFVDAYASWCGPCKQMAKTVFTQKEVGDFFNKHFINMKLNMEKAEAKPFKRKFSVSAYPTLFFIDGNEKKVHKVKGAQQAEALLRLGQMALSKVDYSEEFAKKYEDGNRDPELIYNYVRALNKSGKPSLKIANDYIKSQKDLTTEQNLKFILEATSEADSRIFDLLIKHRSKIAAVSSEQAINNKIENACIATAEKAVEFESADLLQEAKDKMKKHYPEKAQAFALNADVNYCVAVGDCKGYLKATNSLVKKEIKNDPDKLHNLALDIQKNFSKDAKAMKQAEQFAKKAAFNKAAYQYFYTYADILSKNGKKSLALEMANKSLLLAKGNRGVEQNIQKLIRKIEG